MRTLPALALTVAALLTANAVVAGAAPSQISIDLPSGASVPVERHPAKGAGLLVWIPSEHGVRSPQGPIAEALAARGIETWVVDLHSGYFVPVGRSSMDAFPVDDMVALLREARQTSGKRIFVASTGRGALLTLEAIRAAQAAGDPPVRGAVLFHPYLYAGRARAGEDPPLAPIVSATNVPVYIIQPSLSAKHFRSAELGDALQQGGSRVFQHPLRGVTDGFHLRTDADLTAADLAARADLPAVMERALRLLDRQPEPGGPAALGVSPAPTDAPRGPEAGLRALPGAPPAPSVRLAELGGDSRSLEAHRGEVVLVSFWASWCPPCVEEIPSLNALQRRLGDRPFRILSVNVGEDEATIRAFLARHPVEFPVLLDPNGESVAAWKVYAYPTNYLVDAEGRLRHGHFGALDWTSPEALATIEALLAETVR